jgi:hypothetical protein
MPGAGDVLRRGQDVADDGLDAVELDRVAPSAAGQFLARAEVAVPLPLGCQQVSRLRARLEVYRGDIQ